MPLVEHVLLVVGGRIYGRDSIDICMIRRCRRNRERNNKPLSAISLLICWGPVMKGKRVTSTSKVRINRAAAALERRERGLGGQMKHKTLLEAQRQTRLGD